MGAVEIQLLSYATQRGLREDLKLATEEGDKRIRKWSRRVRTLGQRAYGTLATNDQDAIQRDQFVERLLDSDIQESLWKKGNEGF